MVGRLFLAVCALALGGAGLAQSLPPAPWQADTTDFPLASYVPQRVYDSQRKRFTDFESMVADLAWADVVLVGEQHDDPATHRLELAILEGLARRRGAVVLALEMFERDVQERLDEYLAGRIREEEFLKDARPWPRYATDYRPLVEFAKAQRWSVIAGNAPRRLANAVSQQGLAYLDSLGAYERAHLADQLDCPFDRYFDRFVEEMNAHPQRDDTPADKRLDIARYYFAQCVKDETMGEAIALASQTAPTARTLVVHINGAFHSDFGHGTASRARRRLGRSRMLIVTILPVPQLDRLKPDKDDRKRADYLVYTLAPPREAAVSVGAER